MKNIKIALDNISKFQSSSKSLTEFAEEVILGNEFTYDELVEKFQASISVARARIDGLKDRGFVFEEHRITRGKKILKCINCNPWTPNPRTQRKREEPKYQLNFVKKSSISVERYVDSLINQVFGAL
ncbi:hypothetical protein P7245_22300 [Vibrio parahaemolyticus]|nr:hypothetical protein [Vibrio parahaemolyticus]